MQANCFAVEFLAHYIWNFWILIIFESDDRTDVYYACNTRVGFDAFHSDGTVQLKRRH